MARREKHWQKIEAHLKKWAAELDQARVGAEAEVAKVQTQYYQRMALAAGGLGVALGAPAAQTKQALLVKESHWTKVQWAGGIASTRVWCHDEFARFGLSGSRSGPRSNRRVG